MEKVNDLPRPFELSHDDLPPRADYHFQLNRRDFFKLIGGGLAVAFIFKDIACLAGESSSSKPSLISTDHVGAWIHIGEDGNVSVFTGKVEVGQNIRTSLSQMVAEELAVPLTCIRMIMGDTDLVPYDAGTYGSRTTPQMGTQLRKAAATARHALLDIAARKWSTDRASLKAYEGMIVQPETGNKISYGELTKGEKLLLSVSENVNLIRSADWKVAGKTVPKVNGQSFITGKHQYVSDMKLPEMLYGKILRPPAYQSKLTDIDLSKAKAIPGVVVVKDGNFVGVAAINTATAEKAIRAIRAEWETERQPARSAIFDYLLENAEEGRSTDTRGSIKKGMTLADITHANTYQINYIAHVPLEPRAAVAQWEAGKLTVWTGTQRPFGVQQELADAFNLSKENVRVIMPDTGSAYGGKHSGEAAIEAARLAKEAKKPVKLVWTREEEFKWAYFRPAGVINVDSGVKNDGSITAWSFKNYNSGSAAIETQYRIPHCDIAYHPSKTPLRQGSYRGLASTANVFARESHIADMARLIKMDQLEFRLRNLEDDRLKTVLKTAAKAFGWKNLKPAEGHGYGMACGYEKGGYVATCAEIAVNGDNEVQVVRITEAFECGAIVNPAHVKTQTLGAIVQGLGGALFEAIDFADGKIVNANLSSYRVPRFSDVPPIDVVIIDRKDLPSAGAGEAPIIGVAPAIRNAILDATGIGLTSLPMLPKGVLTKPGL